MNVSIATVAKDVGTTVTGIQTAITLYTLVMAMLMITGGKIGSMIGRKRAFSIGCVIYGLGSFTTSIAKTLGVLIFGWSFLEGVGAALIMPAIVALVAGNFPLGRPRAYGLIMAVAGAIALARRRRVATTYFSWRVFVGEVVSSWRSSCRPSDPDALSSNGRISTWSAPHCRPQARVASSVCRLERVGLVAQAGRAGHPRPVTDDRADLRRIVRPVAVHRMERASSAVVASHSRCRCSGTGNSPAAC
jgi:hypothetical protein